MLKVLLRSVVHTATAQVAMALLTWATDYKYRVVLLDVVDEEGVGDETVH